MWHEFLRVTDFSVGLYVIRAGGVDPQSPHHEDEIYFILSGKGCFGLVTGVPCRSWRSFTTWRSKSTPVP